MPYTTEIKEKTKLLKKEAINNYINDLAKELGTYKIDIKKHENAPDYVDAILKIGDLKFVFVFTHVRHDVLLSNNKNWKILRSRNTNVGDYTKRNPSKWIPDKYAADFYVFPVLHPHNKIEYNRNIMIIDDYESTKEFVIKKVRKG